MNKAHFSKGLQNVKFTLEQTTWAQRGSGSYLHSFFNLGAGLGGGGGQRHAPAALPGTHCIGG